MKKYIYKALCILFVLLISLSLVPLPVYANGPAPMPVLCFSLQDLPAGTAYVDLAVCAPESEITQLAQNPPEGLTKDCPLVRGEYEEYVSYSFRVQGAESNIVPDADGVVFFSHADEIPKWGKVRLVMADSSGSILKISKPFNISPRGLFTFSLNTFTYNAILDILQMDTHVSAFAGIVYMLISIAGLILTCGVEWIVGRLFNLTSLFGKLILVTNIVSQVLMRILFLILYSILPQYVLVMLILEVLVYVGEFVVYRFQMDCISVRKCIFYAVTANTASLLLGLLLNLYLL